MTPLEIETLLHAYVCDAPFERPSNALSEACMWFVDQEVFIIAPERKCGYKVSKLGKVLVEMLCATPMPICVDPRKT